MLSQESGDEIILRNTYLNSQKKPEENYIIVDPFPKVKWIDEKDQPLYEIILHENSPDSKEKYQKLRKSILKKTSNKDIAEIRRESPIEKIRNEVKYTTIKRRFETNYGEKNSITSLRHSPIMKV